jgi:hypothetical protein
MGATRDRTVFVELEEPGPLNAARQLSFTLDGILRMKNIFVEIMKQRTDSELMEILTKDRADYQPGALKATEAELGNRKLTIDQIESAKQEIKAKEQLITEKSKYASWNRLETVCIFISRGMVLFNRKDFND